MKAFYWCIALALVTILSSLLLPDISISEGVVMTLFTVVGIMFSVSMSIVIGFNTDEIYNETYLTRIRRDLKHIRSQFIFYLVISVVLYLLYSILPNHIISLSIFRFDYALFVSFFEIYTIIYYTYNLTILHDLSNAISDKIKEEKKNREKRG